MIRAALALVALLLLPGTALADYSKDDGMAWDAPTIYVTGYALPGRTASGAPVGPGVAACPRWMEFGTRLQLSGKVELAVTCLDRYAGWLTDRVDVWVRFSREAFAITGMYRYSVLAGSEGQE